MEKHKARSNPTEYLDERLGPVGGQTRRRRRDHYDPADYPESINGQLASFDKDAHGPGEIELNFDSNKIVYEYDEVNRSTVKKLHGSKAYKRLVDRPGLWRELTKAKISNQVTGESFDVVQELPEGSRAFFNIYNTVGPLRNKDMGQGMYYSDSQAVLIDFNITKPDTFLVLMHEYAHAVDEPGNENYTWNKGAMGVLRVIGAKVQGTADEFRMAKQLLKERSAWAIALKELRPYLSNDTNAVFNKERIITKVMDEENSALGSHESWLRDRREELLLRKLGLVASSSRHQEE